MESFVILLAITTANLILLECKGNQYSNSKVLQYHNATFTSKYMVFKLLNNATTNSNNFIPHHSTDAHLSPLHCAGLCIRTESCCGFFFKRNEYCNLVDQYANLTNAIVAKGMQYYEKKVKFYSTFLNLFFF